MRNDLKRMQKKNATYFAQQNFNLIFWDSELDPETLNTDTRYRVSYRD